MDLKTISHEIQMFGVLTSRDLEVVLISQGSFQECHRDLLSLKRTYYELPQKPIEWSGLAVGGTPVMWDRQLKDDMLAFVVKVPTSSSGPSSEEASCPSRSS